MKIIAAIKKEFKDRAIGEGYPRVLIIQRLERLGFSRSDTLSSIESLIESGDFVLKNDRFLLKNFPEE